MYKILIVDDESIEREGISFLIEKYKVIYKEIANERTKHKEKFRI